jgi:hypothetical protein
MNDEVFSAREMDGDLFNEYQSIRKRKVFIYVTGDNCIEETSKG